MILRIEKCKATIKLNEPTEKETFSRIFSFKDHNNNGIRVRMRFSKKDDLAYSADEIEQGQDDFEKMLSGAERSHLDRPRLLNRGGASSLKIGELEFKITTKIKSKDHEVVLLSGKLNKELKEERSSISLSPCVTNSRAVLALLTADMTGIELPYTVNPTKLAKAYEDLQATAERTLYNNISGKRYGWALLSRKGVVDDIHGRRYAKYGKETEFNMPTPVFTGYLKEIIEEISEKVGKIHRARIIGLNGPRAIAPHHDGHDGTFFYRFHIPIVPNANCVFSCKGHDFVMDKPGQLYQFAAWETHSVVNYSGERVHLLFSGEKEFPH